VRVPDEIIARSRQATWIPTGRSLVRSTRNRCVAAFVRATVTEI
jgi:hypothetical protein